MSTIRRVLWPSDHQPVLRTKTACNDQFAPLHEAVTLPRHMSNPVVVQNAARLPLQNPTVSTQTLPVAQATHKRTPSAVCRALIGSTGGRKSQREKHRQQRLLYLFDPGQQPLAQPPTEPHSATTTLSPPTARHSDLATVGAANKREPAMTLPRVARRLCTCSSSGSLRSPLQGNTCAHGSAPTRRIALSRSTARSLHAANWSGSLWSAAYR